MFGASGSMTLLSLPADLVQSLAAPAGRSAHPEGS
jgi:hypothetical protein